MKLIQFSAILIFTFLILYACQTSKLTENADTFDVSGHMIQKGAPVSGVQVIIDDKLNYSSVTDQEGYFLIEEVPEGLHTIEAEKLNDNGSFVEFKSEISLTEDLYLASLTLPSPVILEQPISNSDNSITLRWSKSDAIDFREYKIYRHTTSGLDETTGLLSHVSVARNDTSFTDTGLDPRTAYYYRVFVMNEFGRLGGSNVASATTENKNFIYNGDFENAEDPYLWWRKQWGRVELTDSVKHSGNYSLHFMADTMFVYQGYHYYAEIWHGPIVDLQPGKWYRLSLWIKTEGSVDVRWWGYIESQYTHLRAGVGNHGRIGHFGISGDTDWTYVERNFYVQEGDDPEDIHLVSSSEHAWFDDIKLELVED